MQTLTDGNHCLCKSATVVSNLSIPTLLISDFKLAKAAFLADFDTSTHVAFSKSVFAS